MTNTIEERHLERLFGDVLKRLREQITENTEVMLDAAAEIERLRARIADLEEQILCALGEKA